MTALKSRLILSVALILLCLQLSAQSSYYLSFKSLPDMPYISEWPATVTDGSRIFAINNYALDPYSQDVLMLDPAQSYNWSIYNNNAGQKTQAAAAYEPANNHIYVFGGYFFERRSIFNSVQSLDLNTHEITILGVHNPLSTMSGCAAEWQGLIYIFGGTQGGNVTSNGLFSFNPQTNEFKQLAKMPEHLQTAGTIVNGVLYTFGGYNSTFKEQSANINAYDIKADKWETVAKLAQPVSANSVVSYGDLIFVIGDYNKENFLGYFNTKTKKFTTLTSNMSGHRAGGAAVVGDLLYVFGGKTDPGQASGGFKNVEVADLGAFKLDSPSVKQAPPKSKVKHAKPTKKV